MWIQENSPISFVFLSFAAGFGCHLSSSLNPPISLLSKTNIKYWQIKYKYERQKTFLWLYRGVSVYFACYKSENKVTVSRGGKTYLSRRCHYRRTRAKLHVIMLISLRAGNFTSSWRPPRRLQCLLKVSNKIWSSGYLRRAPAGAIWETQEHLSLENFQKLNIPADCQQNTHQSSSRCRVLLKAMRFSFIHLVGERHFCLRTTQCPCQGLKPPRSIQRVVC